MGWKTNIGYSRQTELSTENNKKKIPFWKYQLIYLEKWNLKQRCSLGNLESNSAENDCWDNRILDMTL